MKYIFAILILTGCASQEHKRELLQKQNPDCYVFESLLIECPDPFSSNAGFGADVRVIKTPLIIEQPKKKRKKK